MEPGERLDAWGVCHELAVAVYRATREWPAVEASSLAAQARRDVFAATVHLADEPLIQERRVRQRRVGRSLESLVRLAYSLLLARDLGYLPVEQWETLDKLRHRGEELTRALYRVASTPPRLLR